MIETPEEFAKRHYDAIATMSVNGVLYLRDLTKARDAAIRAECAERAIACLKNNYQDWPNIVTGIHQLRAAIMAEPKEGV